MHAVSTAQPAHPSIQPTQPIHPIQTYSGDYRLCSARCLYRLCWTRGVYRAFWVDESDHFSLSIYVFRQLADHHLRFFCHHVSLS